jgi:hypothetical protein
MKNYEVIAEQLKIKEFLNRKLAEKPLEYEDIKRQVLIIEEKEARNNLYKTAKGLYDFVSTENLFHHCKRMLTKDGIEGNKAEEVIYGAVMCSLIDFVLKPKADLNERHIRLLEDFLEIEQAIYLVSPRGQI